jgi:glycosyltransferase involved in cell wall biosynthesis
MLGAMVPCASLVIPTRDRSRALARTLAALTRQRRTDFEVVIVDDGSTDDTAAMLDGFRDRLDLTVVRQAGRGIAAARTVAMRAARAPILIQSDDDRVPDANFVADHVAAHAAAATVGPRVVAGQQRGLLAAWSVADDLPAAALAAVVARDPAVAAAVGAPAVELVSPEALAADLDGALARLAVDEPWWVRHGGPLRARYGADLEGFAFPWAAAIGGNTSVPAELAAAVGYLDDGFVSWGLEDTDFHYRLCQAGARVHLLDGGRSYHQLQPSWPRPGAVVGRQRPSAGPQARRPGAVDVPGGDRARRAAAGGQRPRARPGDRVAGCRRRDRPLPPRADQPGRALTAAPGQPRSSSPVQYR